MTNFLSKFLHYFNPRVFFFNLFHLKTSKSTLIPSSHLCNSSSLNQIRIISETLMTIVHANESLELRFLDVLFHNSNIDLEVCRQLICSHTSAFLEGLTYLLIVASLAESFELNGLDARLRILLHHVLLGGGVYQLAGGIEVLGADEVGAPGSVVEAEEVDEADDARESL